MGTYSDKILQMVDQIGKPIKSTSTTTATADEGIDLSGLLTMLMMSQMFKPASANLANAAIANPAATLGPMNPGGTFGGNLLAQGGMQSPATGGITSPSGLLQLISALSKIGI
jgi:hypothetical protein